MDWSDQETWQDFASRLAAAADLCLKPHRHGVRLVGDLPEAGAAAGDLCVRIEPRSPEGARLEQAEARKALAASRSALETPFPGATAGNPNGDVKLVVFFDYACPYCRQGHADVAKLVREDPKLMVIYRDFPVLSPASTEAAMASLSAATQGGYRKFHDAMFDSPGRVSLARTMGIVKGVGLSEDKVTADLKSAALKAEVDKNLVLGRELGLTGTPSYIIGNRILSGAVGFDRLKEAVAAARAEKGR